MQQQLQRLLNCTRTDCEGGQLTPCKHKGETVLRCLGCNDIKYRGMTP